MLRALLLPAVALTASCASYYVDDADREVNAILVATREAVQADRADNLREPTLNSGNPGEPTPDPSEPPPTTEGDDATPGGADDPPSGPPAPDDDPEPAGQDDEASPGASARRDAPRDGVEGDPTLLEGIERTESGAVLVDLARTLALAFEYNRDYKNRAEALYQTGLGLTSTRFQFGPQFNWAVSTFWADDEGVEDRLTVTNRFDASQILPTGGRVGLNSNLSGTISNRPSGDFYQSSVGLSLNQPLLAGAGYEVSHESLTQAERSMIYSVRDFVLFRQDFAIQRAQSYFDLLAQRETLQNEERNYNDAVFDREKAEALFATGRSSEQEVILAKRREFDAEGRLVDQRVAFNRSLDQFKIELGLPIETRIELASEEPEFIAITIAADEAFELARHNRIDLLTERQQVEDAERGVRIANNGLLPDLDLTANYTLTGSDGEPSGAGPDQWSASLGLNFEVPIQQLPERNSYRSALIGLAQARRGYRDLLDQLEIQIADQVRSLISVERQIEIQREQIAADRRAVRVAEIRFEQGSIDNRNLLDARNSLVNARNALITLNVSHFIGRLRLLRDLGLLFIDEEGMWQ